MLRDAQGCFFLFFNKCFGFIEHMELSIAFSFVRAMFFTLRGKNYFFQDSNALF